MSENTEPQVENIEALFVQSAHGLTSSEGTVTFHGLAHSTLFFADRPQRVVGHLHSRKFVDQWGEGENSFAEDPPNAVVSFLVGIPSPTKSMSLTGRSRPRRGRARCSLTRSAGRYRRFRSRACAVASAVVTAASGDDLT